MSDGSTAGTARQRRDHRTVQEVASETNPSRSGRIPRTQSRRSFAQPSVSRSIQQILMTALIRMERSPNLSPDEVEWVRKLAMRLMTDVTLVKSARPDRPAAA